MLEDVLLHFNETEIEDDLLVTNEGHDNLTALVPKEIAEIEALMAQGHS